MSEVNAQNEDKSKDNFNVLSFERKLVELVEELRLRRNLERENEKTLKSVMDEKYNEELAWDERHRRQAREREDLEQQMDLLRRKLEDKVCVQDDDKAKQHVINRTYSHELRMLKEELRTAKSEKLTLQKKIQELEGKLGLHSSFQEGIMAQLTEVRNAVKDIFLEGHRLTEVQRNVMENVSSAKASFRTLEVSHRHLQKAMGLVGDRNEALRREIVANRSELTMLKNSLPSDAERSKKNKNSQMENLQRKILELEDLFALSRKENEKTLANFLESNALMCRLMEQYSQAQEREKEALAHAEQWRDKWSEAEDRIRRNQEEADERERLRLENRLSSGVQTEDPPKAAEESLLSASTYQPDTGTTGSEVPRVVEEMELVATGNTITPEDGDKSTDARHDTVMQFEEDPKQSVDEERTPEGAQK